jgi:hypothetical protein
MRSWVPQGQIFAFLGAARPNEHVPGCRKAKRLCVGVPQDQTNSRRSVAVPNELASKCRKAKRILARVPQGRNVPSRSHPRPDGGSTHDPKQRATPPAVPKLTVQQPPHFTIYRISPARLRAIDVRVWSCMTPSPAEGGGHGSDDR